MKLKYILTVFFILLITSTEAFSYSDKVIQEGEEIVYEVSYLGIKLGTISVETQESEKLGDKILYKAKSLMKSYSGIPFFSLRTRFESWMDPTLSYSHKFAGNSKFSDEPWVYQKLNFNYDDKNVEFNMWRDRKHEMKKIFDTEKKWNDGLSLFFLARQYADIGKSIKIPTFMNEDTAYTVINFKGKRDVVEVDAIDYPVRTIYFNGKALWEGIYGLSGNFEGWFSDDEARIPIKAHMKVIIGNITIKLIKWKRNNWSPPRSET